MRIIHTSDWHLGRIFHGIHLTNDQAYILDQFVELVKDSNPDVILVSGDIFDRSVPPTEAVNLLDDVVSRIILNHGIPIIIIAGNHDSADRLGFGSRLLQKKGLNIFGKFRKSFDQVVLYDQHGPVNFYSLPYVEPATIRDMLEDETIHTHDETMLKLIEYIKGKMDKKSRNILLAHTFVAGGEESESERPLSVGGSGIVNAAYFKDFDYVALGHLHKAQKVGTDKIRYSGSLMKYSFSEANHKKTVSIIDIDGEENIAIENIELKPKRDLRKIEGFLEDILQGPQTGENKDDYLMITLKDEGAILDPIGKIRKVYHNVLHIERPQLQTNNNLINPDRDFKKMHEIDLFSSFFKQVTDRDISPEQKKVFELVMDKYYKMLREG